MALATPLPAQTTAYVVLGGASTSKLVEDSIIQPIVVSPQTALTGVFGIGIRVSPRLDVGGEVQYARANLQRTEGGTTADINRVTMINLIGTLAFAIAGGFGARFGIGAMRYSAEEQSGIFRLGGTVQPIGSGALRYTVAIGAWGVGAEARYDLSQFTTDELENQGFAGTQAVHRFTIGLTVARTW